MASMISWGRAREPTWVVRMRVALFFICLISLCGTRLGGVAVSSRIQGVAEDLDDVAGGAASAGLDLLTAGDAGDGDLP